MQTHDQTKRTDSSITIRRMDLTETDRGALERLAGLDSGQPLEAPVLGLEIAGTLLAATSLTSGETIADPFSRTGELRSMLELRAAQLRRRDRSRMRLRGHRRSRLAIGGGPAGRIVTLPRWG